MVFYSRVRPFYWLAHNIYWLSWWFLHTFAHMCALCVSSFSRFEFWLLASLNISLTQTVHVLGDICYYQFLAVVLSHIIISKILMTYTNGTKFLWFSVDEFYFKYKHKRRPRIDPSSNLSTEELFVWSHIWIGPHIFTGNQRKWKRKFNLFTQIL